MQKLNNAGAISPEVCLYGVSSFPLVRGCSNWEYFKYIFSFILNTSREAFANVHRRKNATCIPPQSREAVPLIKLCRRIELPNCPDSSNILLLESSIRRSPGNPSLAKKGVEPSRVGQVVGVAVAQVPLTHQVGCVARLLQILTQPDPSLMTQLKTRVLD
jgi:hypothetical protein